MKKILFIYLLSVVNLAIAQTGHVHTENSGQEQGHQHIEEPAEHIHDHDNIARDHEHEHENEHEHKEGTGTIILRPQPFIKTIHTTGTIKVLPQSETIITAAAAGIINFAQRHLVAGTTVEKGDELFSISGRENTQNNIDLQFLQAKNNYLQSRENFLRAKKLVRENILSQKEFLVRKAQFESDSTVYFLLQKNFQGGVFQIKSPAAGSVFQVYVQNGDFVQAGEKLAVISISCHNYLTVDLPKKYYSKITHINSGNFRPEYSTETHSFHHPAKLSVSDRLSDGNPFIAINFSLGHNHDLLPGSFAEVWLDAEKTENSMVVPKSALIEQQGLYFVFVKHGENDFLKTPVKIEAMNAENVKISAGLHFGDEVVTQGVVELKLSQAGAEVDPHAGHNH